MPANKANRNKAYKVPISTSESINFPQGYGDFVMQSSNHMLFYFPSAIFSHISPFFKEILAGYATRDKHQPFLMEEDSRTIFLLLCHVDPLMKTPPINESSISNLVKAAYKYQIASVIQWFQEEVFMVPPCPIEEISSIDGMANTNTGQAFAQRHPLLVLSLAEQFGLGDLSRRMLRLLIKGPISALHANNVVIDGSFIHHLVTLRQKRVEWHLGQLQACAAQFDTNKESRCPGCRSNFFEWILCCTNAIHDTPTWSNIAFSSQDVLEKGCSLCEEKSDVKYASKQPKDVINISNWGASAISLEEELPGLPNKE